MVDIFTPEKRSEIMSRIRGKDTSPERVVRSLAHALGYRYRLHKKSLPGSPDLVFASRRKVIFVHGCFWHRHRACRRASLPASNQDYWAKKFERNIERDTAAIEALRLLGWEALVIWQCELKIEDAARLTAKIVGFLETGRYNCEGA
ncbi:MAG: very short patch repair endonuclease [Shinella sp.]|nr:very short patch repair endonuclease [Shinella sp.]